MTNYIVADIGGTNIRLAVSTPEGIQHVQKYEYTGEDTVDSIFEQYCMDEKLNLDELNISKGKFAVAGDPVDPAAHIFTNGHWNKAPVNFTNLPFEVELLHDLSAKGYGLLVYEDSDYDVVLPAEEAFMPHSLLTEPQTNTNQHTGLYARSDSKERLSIVSPGTGLGVATISVIDGKMLVESGEGSHAAIPVKTREEWDIVGKLQQDFKTVTYETVCCGPGLVRTYNAVSGNQEDISPKEVVELSQKGNVDAQKTVDFFTRTLARFAQVCALTKKSRL